MSLKTIVLSVLADLDKVKIQWGDLSDQYHGAVRLALAKLQGAAEATPDVSQYADTLKLRSAYEQAHDDGLVSREQQHHLSASESMRLKEEARRQKQKADFQESQGTNYVVCEGGPSSGDSVPISTAASAGVYCMIGSARYQLSQDRQRLTYSPVA